MCLCQSIHCIDAAYKSICQHVAALCVFLPDDVHFQCPTSFHLATNIYMAEGRDVTDQWIANSNLVLQNFFKDRCTFPLFSTGLSPVSS